MCRHALNHTLGELIVLSGHSKWANIKHKKEKVDSQRGKIFTKMGRELAIAVKQGGADFESNSKLKDTIAKAKSLNMPNENILRCIKKASGDANADIFEEINYEGYGPQGIAVIVEVVTDNRNRTAADVRHYFDKFGGNLGTLGCVSYVFDKKGVIVIENDGTIDEDILLAEVLDLGADDLETEKEFFEVTTAPENFSEIREGLEKKGHVFLSADIEMVPQTTVTLPEGKPKEMMEKLIEHLEDLDDVRNVYHNWDME